MRLSGKPCRKPLGWKNLLSGTQGVLANPNIMDDRTVTLTHFGRTFAVSIQTGRYPYGGGLFVQLIDEGSSEDYATVSVNAGSRLADDEFVFKTYSENEGILEELLVAGVVETTGRFVECGFAGQQPICRLLRK